MLTSCSCHFLESCVVSHWGSWHKLPQNEWCINNRDLFVPAMEAGTSRSRLRQIQSPRGLWPGAQTAVFSCVLTWWKQGALLSAASRRALILFVRAPPSCPHHPRGPTCRHHHTGVFWGTHSVNSTLLASTGLPATTHLKSIFHEPPLLAPSEGKLPLLLLSPVLERRVPVT